MKWYHFVASTVGVLAVTLLASSGAATTQAATATYPTVALGSGVQCLLGAWSGSKWVQGTDIGAKVAAGTKYKMYSLAGYLGTSTGAKPESLGDPCNDEYGVTVTPQRSSKYEVIAMAGTWAGMPRLPRLESTNQAVYIKAVSDELKREGLTNPVVKIIQVIRVDLDGDGTSEVLISATNFKGMSSDGTPGPSISRGDYSIVLMRKVVNGQVHTTVVEGEVFAGNVDFAAPNRYDIAGVLDLNGDGRMDIVLHGRYYEGDWHAAYQVTGTQVKEVLTCGCGA